ncbi:phosphopantothenoylcysteine decarboxylase, partial [Pseudomonas fluorescens]
YKHPSTLHNFEKLESYGNLMIPAGEGELASGLSGKGRMAEPEEIITFVENDILSKLPLHDKKVLITAGPTNEAIDPVRFIGNHSSGKMGAALAVQVAEMGAQVHLIMGPSSVIVEHSLIQRIDVTSARDMY